MALVMLDELCQDPMAVIQYQRDQSEGREIYFGSRLCGLVTPGSHCKSMR